MLHNPVKYFFILLLASCLSLYAKLPKLEIRQGDLKRHAFYFAPSEPVKLKKKLPLVFVFHGGGGTAKQVIRFSKFNDLAKKKGFIVVYPQGIDRHWNDGRKAEKFKKHTATVDDVDFIRRLIVVLKKKFPIDERRIFSTGMSNGGIFSQCLAIKLSDQFAAVASVTAQIAKPLAKTKVKEPISVLLMNGTADPLVPYNGGEVAVRAGKKRLFFSKKSHGFVISTEETINFWLKHNQIYTQKKVIKIPDKDSKDGSKAERQEWHSANGLSVILYKITGGGHTWPGRKQYLPKIFIGKTCRDFDGTEVIWQFFKKHPKVKID